MWFGLDVCTQHWWAAWKIHRNLKAWNGARDLLDERVALSLQAHEPRFFCRVQSFWARNLLEERVVLLLQLHEPRFFVVRNRVRICNELVLLLLQPHEPRLFVVCRCARILLERDRNKEKVWQAARTYAIQRSLRQIYGQIFYSHLTISMISFFCSTSSYRQTRRWKTQPTMMFGVL